MTFEGLVASFIRQHRSKYGFFQGYLYLTEKQYQFYSSLFRQKVHEIEKQDIWENNKYFLRKDGRENPFLYRKNSTLCFKFGKEIESKSFAITKKCGEELSVIWVSNKRKYYLLKLKVN